MLRPLAPLRRLGIFASVVTVVALACGTTLSPIFAQDSASPTPQTYRGSGNQPYQGSFADLASEIDAYWTEVFRDAQRSYQSPDIVNVVAETTTGCGVIAPEPNAFYCPPDQTVYLVPQFLQDQERQFGDYAAIAVLSHEWGHHIQNLLGIKGPTSKAFELQADCLMGAFTRHADEKALLDYGDFLEALSTAIDAGDPTFLPEDAPGSHGRPEDRVKALTKGFGGGPVTGCGLQLEQRVESPEIGRIGDILRFPSVGAAGVADYLPEPLPVPQASCFRTDAEGTLSFEELVNRLGGTDEARQRLRDWGWRESAFRNYACDDPPPGSAGWVEIGLHLFADDVSAQAALDYFAGLRAEGTTLLPGQPPQIGDHAAVLSGPAANGQEFTLYTSDGPLLMRVTAIAPTGIPFADALGITQNLISRFANTPAQPVGVAASAYLPGSLPVTGAACFTVREQGIFRYSDVVSFLEDAGATPATISALGWQDGAYIDYACATPSDAGADFLEVVVHRFASPQAAETAVGYWEDGYIPSQLNEVYLCQSSSAFVVCADGTSPSVPPYSDVRALLREVSSAVA